jgi:hypothetical protein
MNPPAPILSSGRIGGDRDRRFKSLIHFFIRSTMEGSGSDIEIRVAAIDGGEGRTALRHVLSQEPTRGCIQFHSHGAYRHFVLNWFYVAVGEERTLPRRSLQSRSHLLSWRAQRFRRQDSDSSCWLGGKFSYCQNLAMSDCTFEVLVWGRVVKTSSSGGERFIYLLNCVALHVLCSKTC